MNTNSTYWDDVNYYDGGRPAGEIDAPSLDLGALTAKQLEELVADAQAELTARQRRRMPRRVVVELGAYNERRYGQPWIARVVEWPVGRPASLVFGRWLGRAGSAGELEIMATPGDIIRWGQKDTRGNGTVATWCQVQDDGTVTRITEAEARKAYPYMRAQG